jgi:hypothetical protein
LALEYAAAAWSMTGAVAAARAALCFA